MNFKLFREFSDLPLGWKPGWSHYAIRSSLGLNRLDLMESALTFYGHEVEWVTDITQADAVVFNLDRNHLYSHLNPVLLLDRSVLQTLQRLDTPVIFWHAGECHDVVNQSWFALAQNLLGRPIWLVDSNARSAAANHLFFDSSDLWIQDNDALQGSQVYTDMPRYDVAFATSRPDAHKHVIYNYLSAQTIRKYLHYAPNGNPVDLDARYQGVLAGFDRTAPPQQAWIAREDLAREVFSSAVIISVGTSFIGNFPGENPHFDPLYITERFRQDLCSNRPVVPIGHRGVVQYCREQGFVFPHWIDYGYDTEPDHDTRMRMILHQLGRICGQHDLAERSQRFLTTCNNRELSLGRRCGDQLDKIVQTIFTQSQ